MNNKITKEKMAKMMIESDISIEDVKGAIAAYHSNKENHAIVVLDKIRYAFDPEFKFLEFLKDIGGFKVYQFIYDMTNRLCMTAYPDGMKTITDFMEKMPISDSADNKYEHPLYIQSEIMRYLYELGHRMDRAKNPCIPIGLIYLLQLIANKLFQHMGFERDENGVCYVALTSIPTGKDDDSDVIIKHQIAEILYEAITHTMGNHWTSIEYDTLLEYAYVNRKVG